MTKPVYEIFAKGVEATVWENTAQDGKKYLTIKIKDRVANEQGIKSDRDYFPMYKVPLVISALQRLYTEFSTIVTSDNRERKDLL